MSTPAVSTTKTPKKSGYDMPWVERYRPETLEDVVGNEDTIVRLRAIAKDGNMPNLILCGPPGTGKVNST
jgi:replication factor C subunit 2/4